jgi:endo-1,4-beta-xylanase
MVTALLLLCVIADARAAREEDYGDKPPTPAGTPAKPAQAGRPAAPPVTPARGNTLKERYRYFFPVGNVVSPRDLGTARFDLLTKHFDILTAENAMKPLYLQREKGVFTFDEADKLVDAVIEAGLRMHGHTLAWHQQSPEWINREGIDREEAIDNLVTHVQTVADHFQGRIVSWDVLNEAINDNPNPQDWRAALRQVPWYNAIGDEYIAVAFRAAREADPYAVLYYNDYNLDNPNKAMAVYNMVKEINEKNPNVLGRPLIDGIGMQGHYRVGVNVDNVAASLKRFISLGVEVSITELDIQAGADYTLTEEQTIQQGAVFARLFALFRENADALGRVTIWGLDDGTSWRSMTSPTLFDRDLREKPAFFAALDPAAFLAQNEGRIPVVVKKDPLQAAARYGAPSLDASDRLWRTAAEIPINQHIMAWQGASGTARVLWDEQALYVMIAVNGAELNKANPAPHEQDSIEIFIDEGNHKAGYMQNDDGQYRVNFDNETSFNPPSIAEGFESQAVVVFGGTYVVTAKIPWKTIKPEEGAVIGFDLQVNGASARGMRQSVAVWNDTTGNAWQDTSLYGLLRLVKDRNE